VSHWLRSLVSGKDVERDRKGRAQELLWPTATKAASRWTPEGGTLSLQDIAIDLEHPDQFTHGSLDVHAPHFHNKSNNQHQFHFNPECLIVYASPYMLMKS
jgi:hypothetical protein